MKRTMMSLLVAATLAVSSAIAGPRTVTAPDAPRALPEGGPVAVQWTDPAEFTDLKFSGNRWEAERGNWVHDLAEQVRQSAQKQLNEGERLEITITDIDRAGSYLPGMRAGADHIRIMTDIYPPSMELEFKRYDANDQLVAEGTRKLHDMNYLANASFATPHNDALRFEKRMIDNWARREFAVDSVADR